MKSFKTILLGERKCQEKLQIYITSLFLPLSFCFFLLDPIFRSSTLGAAFAALAAAFAASFGAGVALGFGSWGLQAAENVGKVPVSQVIKEVWAFAYGLCFNETCKVRS